MPKMTKAMDRMVKARTALLLDYPFYGALALRLKLVEEPGIPTAATDGRLLMYNPEFIMGLSGRQLLGLVCHEVLHCTLIHPYRRDARDPMRWNVACDLAINPIVLESEMELPEGVLVDEQYKGKSAEWIYARLPEVPPNYVNIGGVQDAPKGSGQGEGQGDGSEGADGDSKGSASGEHPTEEEWQIAVQQAAAQAKARGKLPGALERFAKELSRPKVNWRAVLRRFVQEQCRTDYSWSRPSTRFLPHGLYLPALHSEELGPLVVVIDTSGSVDNVLLAQFGGEVQAIIEETNPSRVHVWYCDARINHKETFEQGEPLELRAKGGGGTDFRPAFRELENLDEDPVAMLYLTDMWGAFPDEDPGLPVLWVTPTEEGQYAEIPFGEVVEIRE